MVLVENVFFFARRQNAVPASLKAYESSERLLHLIDTLSTISLWPIWMYLVTLRSCEISPWFAAADTYTQATAQT